MCIRDRRGFDQITAKFTGTSVKVLPGEHNMGIFITLANRDNETYQLTHPCLLYTSPSPRD